MRAVIFACVLVIVWKFAITVDPRESFQVLQRSSNNEQIIKRANFKFLQNELTNELITAINQLAESNVILNVSSLCIIQLNKIIAEANAGNLWALQIFDSWGKFPSGIMWGHLVEYGNFDECLSIHHEYRMNQNVDSIMGQYCIAHLPFGDFLKNVSEDLSKIPIVKVGLCIPRSCDEFYANELIKIALFRIFKVNVTTDFVTDEQCIKHTKSDFEMIDWIAMIFHRMLYNLRLFFKKAKNTLLLPNTLENPKPLLLAFSLSVNINLLFRTTSKKSPNIISCLNGIRCMSIVWVIFGHSYMISMFLPNINAIEIVKWAQTPFSMFLQSGTISVDTFFFLSGLLLVWACLKEMEKSGGRLNVLLMYLHRYIRLTPVVAAAMLFFVSLFRHMGDGPLWNGFTNTYKLCHETWWATLLYVQNYAAAGRMCIGHTWYLAVDMQLFVLSPLILIPIFKWKKRALAGVIIVGLLLVACIFTTIVLNNFSVFSTTGNLGTDTQEMRKIYYSTHARASPWFIGIIFGYFLYNKRNRRIKIRKEFIILGWLTSLALLATGIFALYPKTLPGAEPLTALEGAFFLSLIRVAWPLALSWIVFACVNGYGGFVNTFLSWTFWQPMARLSYCMYINHLIIESIHGGRTKVNVRFSNYDVILRFWGDFGATLFVSIVTYLMFESPMVGIEKVLLNINKKKSLRDVTVSKQDLCDNET